MRYRRFAAHRAMPTDHGCVFIRSASATAFVLRALNLQDGSNSSGLTSTNVPPLASPPPEKQKVASERPWDGVRELSLSEHRRALCQGMFRLVISLS
jgi:hypothetical protein